MKARISVVGAALTLTLAMHAPLAAQNTTPQKESVFSRLGRAVTQAANATAAPNNTTAGRGNGIRVVKAEMGELPADRPTLMGDAGVELGPRASCGTELACVAGWDLRLVKVQIPAPVLPAGEEVLVSVEVQNRGKQSSPASEFRICSTFSDNTSGYCSTSLALGDIPPLPSGQTAVIRQVVKIPESEGQLRLAAVIDPDQVQSDARRENNAASSEQFMAKHPELSLLGVTPSASSYRKGAPVTMTLRIRNKSVAVTSPATEIGFADNCSDIFWGNSRDRVPVPSLAPRQVYTLTVLLEAGASSPCSGDGRVIFDPDYVYKWSNDHESGINYRYRVEG